eukprot:109630_1
MANFFKNIYENIFPSNWAQFDPDEPSPYNLTTYKGRIAHFYTILDPRTLLINKNQLNESLDMLNKYKQNSSILFNSKTGEIDDKINKKLWESKLIKQSIIHPDTNSPIFWAFRFSAFPVLNIPITTLLLYPGSTTITVVSQFINQTYNVAVNYANRNASNPMTNTKLFVSYVAAVSVSCGIGFGLRQMTKNHNLATNAFLRGFIPYTAITLASCLNLYFIRWNEVTQGIQLRIKSPIKKIENKKEIQTYEWKEVGRSKIAGHVALAKCCIARMIWSIPPLFFPPVIMNRLFLNRRWFIGLKQWQKMCIESSVIGGVLLTFIPPSLATFPQRDNITNKWLEEEFKKNYSADTLFYFNKGL